MKDSDIDYSDIAETNEDFWSDAEIIYPTVNKSFEIDKEIASWLDSFGENSNTVINNVLRSYYFTQNSIKNIK